MREGVSPYISCKCVIHINIHMCTGFDHTRAGACGLVTHYSKAWHWLTGSRPHKTIFPTCTQNPGNLRPTICAMARDAAVCTYFRIGALLKICVHCMQGSGWGAAEDLPGGRRRDTHVSSLSSMHQSGWYRREVERVDSDQVWVFVA